jgi:hypothetical protein
MAKKIIKTTTVLEDDKPELMPGAAQVESENTVADGLKEPKVRYPGKWIKATDAEVTAYQESGQLFGHDPDAGEVLLVANLK